MNPDREFNTKDYFKNAHYKRQKVYFEVEGWDGHFITSSTNHKFLPTIVQVLENEEREFMIMDWCDEHINLMSLHNILYEDYESDNLDERVETIIEDRLDKFEYDKITIL